VKPQHIITVLVLALLLAACGGAPAAQPAPAAPAEPTVQQPAAPAEPAPTVAQADPEPAVDAPVVGGSVTRALTTEPTGLDPAGAQGSGQNVVLPYLFDTLVAQNAQNVIQPLLAESWEIGADAKSITFKLREGITFHDGTPLDAAAVVASFERLLDPERKSPMVASFRAVSAIEAVDDLNVRFDFEAPSALFFTALTSPYSSIVSPTAADELGEQFAQQPVGSGPFKLKSWEPGIALTLERNPDYAWAPPMVANPGAPYLDEVVFKVVPDAATQLTALRAGEVDIIFLNQPDHITRLRSDDSVALVPVSLNSLAYMGFNTVKPPFDNPLVRQALAHAIDKEAIVMAAVGGEGTPAFAPMATTLAGFDPALQSGELGYDPARSAELLAEAGLTQGADGVWSFEGQPLNLILLTFTRAPNQDIATVIQAQLKEVGVPVSIQQFDAPTAGRAAVAGEYDLLLWRYDWNDPDVLAVNLHSSRIGSTNRVSYSNPEVDALLSAAAAELDMAKRAELYVEAQRLIMADAPWQPLYTPLDMLAVNPRMQDIVISSMGRVLLNDVTLR
jgi:peptide/nickel transport system substrate-binding protein